MWLVWALQWRTDVCFVTSMHLLCWQPADHHSMRRSMMIPAAMQTPPVLPSTASIARITLCGRAQGVYSRCRTTARDTPSGDMQIRSRFALCPVLPPPQPVDERWPWALLVGLVE